jgi:DNA-directed RNA polymerase
MCTEKGMEKREDDITKKRQKTEKRRKTEKDKEEITKHEIIKKSIRKEVKIQGNVQERIWSNSLNIFSNSSWFIYALFHPEEARNTFFKTLIL